MSIEIRRAGIDDLEQLMEWRLETMRAVFDLPAGADTKEQEIANREYYRSALPSGEHIACFAADCAQIIGCGGLCLYREMPSPENPSGRCAFLMNIYTRPAFRGQGTGRKIVDWLVGQAKRQGITKIYLNAAPRARPLYARAGFVDMQGYMELTADF